MWKFIQTMLSTNSQEVRNTGEGVIPEADIGVDSPELAQALAVMDWESAGTPFTGLTRG